MNSKGMTLIELIVVMVLLGTIGLFTFQFLGSSVETYIMVSNQAGLFAEAKLAMERMARDIRDAESITWPEQGDSDPDDFITFKRTHATKWDIAGESITFRLTGSTLVKVKESPSVTSLMAENVSAFTVTRAADDEDDDDDDDDDEIEIEIEIVLTLSTGGENVTLHTKVYPKNLPSQFAGNWEEVVVQ